MDNNNGGGGVYPQPKENRDVCPKTMTGKHYFINSGKLLNEKYVNECEFCGIIDDRKG